MMSRPATLAGRRILVVEDEYFIADDVARLLESQDAVVVGPVADVDEALAALARPGAIDAAVLDINLHGEAVYPLADALRARGVPFVFATGYGASSIPVGYRDVPRWEKPYDYAGLLGALPALMSS